VDNIPAYRVGTEHSHKAQLKNNSAQQWAAVTYIHRTSRKSSK